MKIGNVTLDNNVILAPMAGVTDISFRGLCKEMGCGLVVTEMVSTKALYYGSENTEHLLKISKEEMPVAAQIFGSDPKIMAQVVKDHFNSRDDICIIDINMGCPVPKITKNGDGSALMKNPKLAAEIVSRIKEVSTKPVTVKFRKGYTDDNINAVEFALALEDAGADAIAVHGRTKAQMYEGKADWNIIGEVKKAVSIPVIGNGDIVTPEDAIAITEQTNCDGIMIARGSMGNPWIFKQVLSAMKGEEVKEVTPIEKVDMCLRHYELAIKYEGEYKGVRAMRKHASWYLKGLPRSSELRNIVNTIDESTKVIKLLQEYKKEIILNQ